MSNETERELIEQMIQKIEKQFADDFAFTFGPTSTALPNDENNTLTQEKIQKMYDLVIPPLYYGTLESIAIGQIMIFKETKFFPEYIVFNPSDTERVKAELKFKRRLIHLREYKIDPEKLKTFFTPGVINPYFIPGSMS